MIPRISSSRHLALIRPPPPTTQRWDHRQSQGTNHTITLTAILTSVSGHLRRRLSTITFTARHGPLLLVCDKLNRGCSNENNRSRQGTTGYNGQPGTRTGRPILPHRVVEPQREFGEQIRHQ